MSNLSVRKMRIFLAAVEEGSFTLASARENVSQAAETIVINEIEETDRAIDQSLGPCHLR
jgi:DNA-binding transcriptional LysR family regulator